jgi:hypothetical protein
VTGKKTAGDRGRDRLALLGRQLAGCLDLLRNPASYRPGMSMDDEQTLRDIGGWAERLLHYDAVLPPGLVAMLRAYLPELRDTTGGRWEGAGSPAQALHLCDDIAQDITDGRWGPGERISMDNRMAGLYYLPYVPPGTLRRAMQTLTARGEVIMRSDGYYVRTRDDHSR